MKVMVACTYWGFATYKWWSVGDGRRPEHSSGFEKPMKFSGGSDRLVEVVEPRGRSRIGILEDGEELTSAWPPGQTLSDATQTTEDDEATLRELLMRYIPLPLPKNTFIGKYISYNMR